MQQSEVLTRFCVFLQEAAVAVLATGATQV
jgi:hypothetical protein